jgi:membrane-associated phospholipid phosphatase
MSAVALASGLATSVAAQDTASAPKPVAVQPQFSWKLDAPIAGVGLAALLGAAAMTTDVQTVPAAGLDPSTIHWSVDRDAVGHLSTDANAASNWFRNAAVVYPVALAFASAPSDTRLRSTGTRVVVYGESMLLAGGITSLIKIGDSRPRPFTYVPASSLPDHDRYRTDDKRAFHSMPSGHASTTACAASFAITDHLLTRPQAHWLERAAVGFTSGALAASTASLRVEAGQHFPSDVMAGAAIGTATGIGVPLLHRWIAGDHVTPRPTGHAWLQAGAGAVVGIGTGLLIAEGFDH